MSFNKEEAEAAFDNFMMIMDDQLDWLEGEAKKNAIYINKSAEAENLSKLEKLFDLMSEGKDKSYISGLIVTFGRYIGEIVRENYNGQWVLPLDDSKNINFNTPVIVGHSPIDGLEFAPLSVMRGYALRRKEGSLKTALDADTHPTTIDISDLIEES